MIYMQRIFLNVKKTEQIKRNWIVDTCPPPRPRQAKRGGLENATVCIPAFLFN